MSEETPHHRLLLTLQQLADQARSVATALYAASEGASPDAIAGTGGGSQHRALPDDVRRSFLELRTALFHRGLYDPILVRFDTASVPQASTREIAERLKAVAEGLGTAESAP